MSRHTSTWKAVERKVAAHLGGERLPITGRCDDSMPDVKTPVWVVEVKHGAKYSAAWFHLLKSGMYLTERKKVGEAVIPVLALRFVSPDHDKTRHAFEAAFADKMIGTRHLARPFPAWLKKAIGQACAAAKAHPPRSPLVVIHASGTDVLDSICLFP